MIRSQQTHQVGSDPPDLPETALINILQRVPTAQRLSSAALVNTAWAAAASAATAAVAIPADNFSSSAVESLNEWLEQHAEHVHSISIPEHLNYSSTALLLPCDSLTRLATLDLYGCKLKLEQSQDGAAAAAAAALLPALQCVKLHKVDINSRALPALLLTSLTALELKDTPYMSSSATKNAALQQLDTLQHLQSLSIGQNCDMDPSVLSGLGSRLTSLSFTPHSCNYVFTVNAVLAAGWPLLRRLRMHNTPFQPAHLAELTALEELELMECALLPTQEVDGVHGMEEEAAGASDLLAALAQLTSLRSLELYEIDLQAIEVLQRAIRHAEMAGDPEMGLMNFMNNNYLDQFSALTASSKLEKLVLAYRDEHVQRVPLPRHVDLEQIFRPGEQLLHLTELSIDALDLNALADLAEDSDEYDDSDSDSDNSGDEMERRRRHDPYSDHWCICCMDFKLIANCCPNLQCLTLNSVLAHEELQDITVDYPRALRKLQRHLDLKYLCLGGPWLSTASAAAVATMTSLECLELYNAPMLRANALEQLTALRQLEKLEAQGVCCDRQVDFCLVSTAPAGSPPDVWRQLSRKVRDIRALQQECGVEDWGVDWEADGSPIVSDIEEVPEHYGFYCVAEAGFGELRETWLPYSGLPIYQGDSEGEGAGDEEGNDDTASE